MEDQKLVLQVLEKLADLESRSRLTIMGQDIRHSVT